MFATAQPRRRVGLFGLALIAGMLCASTADAAWLGFKNDTNAVVVIQTATVVNGQIRRGKPYVLYPGEVAWEPVATPGIRQINVYDPKANNKQVHQDAVNCQKVDIFQSLQLIVPPAVKGRPKPKPVLAFLPARPPVLPPGAGAILPGRGQPANTPPGKVTAPPAPTKSGKGATPPPTPPGKTPSGRPKGKVK